MYILSYVGCFEKITLPPKRRYLLQSLFIFLCTGTATADLQSYLTRSHLSHLETLFYPVYTYISYEYFNCFDSALQNCARI